MKTQRRNIELKARCSDLEGVRAKAKDLGAHDMGILRQRDTFFTARHARLKLREFGDGSGQLISYVRADVALARGSDYMLAPIERSADVRAALEHALGIVGTVIKIRHLFLLRATRIHLDEVEGLGSFVELETVIDRQPEEEAHSELRKIADALRIEATDLVALPYLEQLGSRPPS